MSTGPNDSACAAAYANRDGEVCSTDGLTKREHFAAMALQGLMANAMENMLPWVQCPALAVEMADALIAELNK